MRFPACVAGLVMCIWTAMTDRPYSREIPGELRDPHLDSLWRATSTEQPPPAVDYAIVALARREARAKPRAAAAAQATRPARWWWPLAAAAAIGVVVIGLL